MSSFLILFPLLVGAAIVLGYLVAEYAGDGLNPVMDAWQALVAISWFIVSLAIMATGLIGSSLAAFVGFIGMVGFTAVFIVKSRAVREADIRDAIMPN